MKRAFIGLGANLGDRKAQLRQAVQRLRGMEGIQVKAVSGIYESEPVGVEDQPPFLNAVVEIATEGSPEALLAALKGIETALGRRPRCRWGPREIDLDLLWYEGERRDSEELAVPHPRLAERAFVLLPWSELAPDLEVWPGRRVLDLLAEVEAGGCRRQEEA